MAGPALGQPDLVGGFTEGPLAGVIGQYRYVELTNSGPLFSMVNINSTMGGGQPTGRAALTGSPLTSGGMYLVYSGAALGGFSPVDITDAGINDSIDFLWNTIDFAGQLTVRIHSSPTDFNGLTLSTPAGFSDTPTLQAIPLASLTDVGGSGANFNAVTSITVMLEGADNAGYLLEEITITPEPASLALLGLGGAALLRRRRRA